MILVYKHKLKNEVCEQFGADAVFDGDIVEMCKLVDRKLRNSYHERFRDMILGKDSGKNNIVSADDSDVPCTCDK